MGTIDVGKRGEEVAWAFLSGKGFKFVARNWRYSHLEIDLIVEDDRFLRIVEVRSLQYPNLIHPFESIGYKKQQLLVKAAEKFVSFHRVKKEVVFDVISIVFKGSDYNLKYIENAFGPVW